MEKRNCLNILLCFIRILCSVQAIPLDWKKYIADDMLEKYSGKSMNSFYSANDFQGDITGITRDSSNNGSIIMNNAINDDSKRWPNGRVPYVMSEQYLTPDRYHELKFIEIAMKQISSITNGCIKFIPRTNEMDYVQIERGLSCSSSIGKQGGKQIILLAVGGCLEEIGSIQHELMHTLGFFHEMSRNDRDDYIWINWDNLLPNYKNDFEKRMDGLTFGYPYDYDSVLHYGWNAFAINNLEPTIVPKQLHERIGQNEGLSILDILKLQRAYKCPAYRLLSDSEVAQTDATTELSTAKTEKTTEATTTSITVASISTQFTVGQWNFNKMLLMADESSKLFRKDANTKEDCNTLCRLSKYCRIAGYERSASLCTGYDKYLYGKMVYSEDYVIVGIMSSTATRWPGWNYTGAEVLYEGTQIADLAGIIWTEDICTQACNIWPTCYVAVYNLKTSVCRMFTSEDGNFSSSPDLVSVKFSNINSNRIESNPIPIVEPKQRLNKAEKLLPGQSLFSPNGDFEIKLDDNGNLELVRGWDQKTLWESKTIGHKIDYLYFGSSGILGLHDSDSDKYIWTSGNTDRDEEVSYFGVTNEGRFGTFNEAGVIIWAGVLDTPLDPDQEDAISSNFCVTNLKIVADRGSFLQSTSVQNQSDCQTTCRDRKIAGCYTANFNKKSMLCLGYDKNINAKIVQDSDYDVCVFWSAKVTRKNGAVYGGDEVKFHGVQVAEWKELSTSWPMTEYVCVLLCYINSPCRVATFDKMQHTCVLKYSGGFVKSDINSSSFVFSYPPVY